MQVGLIGWRGMVGSVLVERMREERDFDLIDPVFFSTSQAGAAAPEIGKRTPAVKDAWTKQGAEPVVMTPEQVTEHLRADIQKLGQMVRTAGAKVD